MQTPSNLDDPRNSDAENQRIPEMVGATSAPFELGREVTHISFAIHPPKSPAILSADPLSWRVLLEFENITSDKMAPSFNVYLNMPPGADPQKHPDLYAGGLAMFGVAEMSRPSKKHPGDGLTYTLPITDLFRRLPMMAGWDVGNLRVSFVPNPWNDAISVEVGRVSLYFE